MESTDKEERGPLTPRKLHVGRYVIATGLSAIWVMVFALHLPIRHIREAWEPFFYPGFMYFLPLSTWYGRLLPWASTDIRSLFAMSVLDTALMAVFCLPFLYDRGRKQDVLALLSLSLLSFYTLVSFHAFLLRRY